MTQSNIPTATSPAPEAVSIDAHTLDRARAGDAEAHALLYARFAPAIFTLARRMTASTSRAEDVLQDTFVEVIRNVERFRSEADIGTWIRRIAINKCLSLLRSRWWGSRVDLDDADLLAGRSDQADTELDLERLLDTLAPIARAVVWLHDAEGYTHREIGELMGRTESFSKSQLHRAHQRLQAEIGPVCEQPVQKGRASTRTEEIDALCVNALKTT
jgi:RNA polymerase sigma factor (sigma-70 family)